MLKFAVKLTGLLIAALLGGQVNAEMYYSVGAGSDYVDAGISQTLEKPVARLTADYEQESGFYAGVWALNVDYGGDEKGIEINYFVGNEFELNDDFALDIGYEYNQYVADDNGAMDGFDYGEIYASLILYEDTRVTIWRDDSEDIWGGLSVRFKIEHRFMLNDDYQLKLSVHHWKTEWAMWDDDGDDLIGDDNFSTFHIGVAREFGDFDISLDYSDTTIEGWDEADGILYLMVVYNF